MAANGEPKDTKSTSARGVINLTDNEKRDILEHLEADQPLSDKYRFLLFDEKREVELVWNGGIVHVAAYLAQRDVSHFNPKARPPRTAAFWQNNVLMTSHQFRSHLMSVEARGP